MDKSVSKLMAVMRFCVNDIQESEIELTGSLVQESSGEEIVLTPSVLSRKKEGADIHVFLIEFELPKLKPGEYSIIFISEETKTKSISLDISEIQVK